MKQKFILILLVVFSTKLFSQCAPTDTVSMGAAYANDVFYSMKNKVVKSVSNNNWHLAFSVQGTNFPYHPLNGVAIRVNSVKGNVLVTLPGANASSWRTIDTTGLSLMPERLDSFASWDRSAFTREYNYAAKPFDFIWGAYNNTSYNVDGSKIFVLYNKTANVYKKIFIKQLGYDTMWDVIISNIDNSDSVNLKFSKTSYPNRLFVYYDIVNKQLNNREPAKTDWDILWTRYKDSAIIFGQPGAYNLTGILANKGVYVAKNLGKKCDEVWPGNVSAPYIAQTNNIGWDWKISPTGPGPYVMVDTFVYFVNGKDGKTYKLSFNSFSGGTLGNTVLNGRDVTSVNDVRTSGVLITYPNPSSGSLTIATSEKIMQVRMIDLKGSEITLSIHNNTVDISELSKGIYILNVQTEKGIYTQKIIKE